MRTHSIFEYFGSWHLLLWTWAECRGYKCGLSALIWLSPVFGHSRWTVWTVNELWHFHSRVDFRKPTVCRQITATFIDVIITSACVYWLADWLVCFGQQNHSKGYELILMKLGGIVAWPWEEPIEIWCMYRSMGGNWERGCFQFFVHFFQINTPSSIKSNLSNDRLAIGAIR